MLRVIVLRCLLYFFGILGLFGLPHPARAASPELEFIPNHGQWPDAVRLRADVAPGLTVFLENQRLTFLRYDAPAWAARAHQRSHAAASDSADAPVLAHAWAVELVGTRRACRPVGEGDLVGSPRNYFIGADARRWASAVRATAAARYPAAWPGISLRLHASSEGAFEYDLEVAPRANPARARLRYHGLEKLALDPASGHLLLTTSVGELREAAPVAWQLNAAGGRTEVKCRFNLDAGNVVSFALPDGYDRRRPLVIDPVLVAATYSGSTSPTFGHTATYDASGHLYAAGPCFDPGYPVTLGAFDLTHSPTGLPGSYDNPDVAISRYSPDGQRLLYATYLGGAAPDYPHSLLVNHRGELLILGSTTSPDFPTTAGAYDRALGHGTGSASDAFVARLDSTGAQLLGSTFVGGSGSDGRGPRSLLFFYGDFYRGDLAVDSLDRVFVATSTESADFPFTPGAVRPALGTLVSSAAVLRLSANLTTLDWAAGLGTRAAAYGLYLPPSGALYVVGTTFSEGFPTTPGTLDPTDFSAGGVRPRDGFVAQLSPNGDSVRAATYLRPGTVGLPTSQTFFVQPDPVSKDIYVLGSSTGFYSDTLGRWGQPGGGVVVQRLSADLRQRRWTAAIGHPVTRGAGATPTATPLPDTDNLSPTAFLVDHCGSLYLSGWGNSDGLPTTPDAIQRVTRTSTARKGGDLYLAVLDPDATGLHYATFLGGSSFTDFYEEHVDGGTSRFDPQGRIYQAVCTNSHNFPVTSTAWRRTNSVASGAYDEVAFKLDFEPRIVRAAGAAATAGGRPTTIFEAPATVRLTNQSTQAPGITWQWHFGDGSAPSTAFAPSHLYPLPGIYTIQLIATDPSACGGADTAYVQITVVANDSTENLAYVICRGDSVQFPPFGAAPGTFEWSPAGSLSSSTAAAPVATPLVSTIYSATGLLPNSSGHTTWHVAVTVLQPDTVLLTAARRCLPGGSAVDIGLNQMLSEAVWEFGDGSAPQAVAQSQAISHFFPAPAPYVVQVRGRGPNGCPVRGEVPITVDALFIPNIFTPNGDGFNETFVIGCLEPGTATLQVYSRWGQLVYDSGPGGYLNQWNGDGLAPGLYFYYLRLSYAPAGIRSWVEISR